jgi:hypothetical protein
MTIVQRLARALSRMGDHCAGWLALSLAGAVLDPPRRRAWLRAGAVVLAADALASVLKRVFRRGRPAGWQAVPGLAAPKPHAFPSSHATTAFAAAGAFGGLLPAGVRYPLATAVAGSRLVLKVHHPGDVVAGALIGWSVSRVVDHWISRRESDIT